MEEQILDQNLAGSGEKINYDEKCQKLIAEDYDFKMGEYISQGFNLFQKDPWQFIGFLFIDMAINIEGSLIPIIGSLAMIVIQPSLMVGFFIVGKKMIHNEPYEFKDFFKGFDFLLHLFLGNLIRGIFVAIGFVILIIPGIYLAVGYMWVFLFIIFAGKEFWPAMELSRQVITKNWFSFLGFAIVIFLINLVGAIALGIGLFVTIPATLLASLAAFNDIVGTNKD